MMPSSWRVQWGVTLGVLAITATACGPSSRSVVLDASSPPGDVYTCVMRELSAMEFRILDTDRASGFVRAEREDPNSWLTGSYWTEITATVVATDAGGSRLQVHLQRSKAAPAGRTSTGLVLTEHALAAAARIEKCGTPSAGSRP